MEASNSQALSIESFSYRWLVNIRSSFENRPNNSFRTSLDEPSFIEMDPTMPPSKRFLIPSSRRSHDFKFPTLSPSPPSSLPLVHADRLISNGYLVPLQASVGTSGAIASPAVKLTAEPRGKQVSACSLRKSCRRLSRQIFEKYLNFLRPLCRRIQRVGGAGNENDIKAGKFFDGGSRRPITGEAHQYCDEWRRSCDSESSIYDAVLHCKRSIGK